MNRFRKALSRLAAPFFRDQRGTETLEWGLICGLIIVGAIAVITLIGPKVQKLWQDVNSSIP